MAITFSMKINELLNRTILLNYFQDNKVEYSEEKLKENVYLFNTYDNLGFAIYFGWKENDNIIEYYDVNEYFEFPLSSSKLTFLTFRLNKFCDRTFALENMLSLIKWILTKTDKDIIVTGYDDCFLIFCRQNNHSKIGHIAKDLFNDPYFLLDV